MVAKNTKAKKIRVAVTDGDGKTPLGLGWYVGDVTVYFVVDPKGNLLSQQEAEEPPSPEFMKKFPEGTVCDRMDDNPKIVLDTGKVVYGCQVWWEQIWGRSL